MCIRDRSTPVYVTVFTPVVEVSIVLNEILSFISPSKLSTAGVKTVTYTGVDSAGNKSEVQLQVEVTFSGERIVNTGLSKTGCPYAVSYTHLRNGPTYKWFDYG